MAIKITTDSIVKMIRPASRQFNIQDLNNHVSGFIEPVKLGPVWLMYDEKAKSKGEPLNEVASFFFDVAIHGTALIVPPQQLPSDWDLMEPEDYKFTANEVDNGVLMTLQNALIHKRVFGAPGPDEMSDRFQNSLLPIEEWTYKPNEESDSTEHTAEFFDKVFMHIKEKPNDIKKNILLSDKAVMVTVETEKDRIDTINQMIDHYISLEEYEKCTFLRDVI